MKYIVFSALTILSVTCQAYADNGSFTGCKPNQWQVSCIGRGPGDFKEACFDNKLQAQIACELCSAGEFNSDLDPTGTLCNYSREGSPAIFTVVVSDDGQVYTFR